jgi:hypothetical protein
MSATSNNATRPASVTGIPEGVGSWFVLVLALVSVAATACALVASAYMADAAGQAPFVGT